ncbi:phosphotransferase enzyme family protein [Paenibacillus sp. Soil724D2]|uniref:phosphotransferase enzyme family protein n=1 Tax=Paenibacillus sp. (strain Soil724D2) TaxID=1736392 RepID=UPI000AE6CF67
MELNNLTIWLYSLKQSKHDYGLIHYDFQQDNIFWQASKSQFHVIDFDDAMYHWYAMDIVAALADVLDHIGRDSSSQVECFLRGYTAIYPLDKQMIEHFPKFLRFSKLYSFSRILTALEDSDLSNTPPWYAGLKLKLMKMTDEMRLGFSNPW